MSKKCKIIVYSIAASIIALIVLGLVKLIFFSGIFWPMISLKGDETMKWQIHEAWREPGYEAQFRFQDHPEAVDVSTTLNVDRFGTYEIRYCYEGKHCKVRTVEVVDEKAPFITLEGDSEIRIFENETWQEPGYLAVDDHDKDISDQVKVKGEVDTDKIGTYKLSYVVEDQSGNKASAMRYVEVCEDPTRMKLHYQFDEYDNTMEEWWIHKSEDHKRNTAAKDRDFLAQYDAYYIGEDEKVIYLTFDEGGNNETYIKEIVDVLNAHDVQATFFFTLNYVRDHPDFMRELLNEGHLIANHTYHHYDMPLLAQEETIDRFVSEITEFEKTYMQVTGKKTEKIFRFPKGAMSERSLKIMQALGYRTYFWSHAFYDYGPTISKQEALTSMMEHYHNGAIYLLHPSNKGNYLAIADFIEAMQEEGYRFGLVNEIGSGN